MRTRLWFGVGIVLAAAVALVGARGAFGISSSDKITTIAGTGDSEGGFKHGYFKTPSGNIQCYGSSNGVVCGIKSGLKPPPPRRGPDCSQTNRVSLSATGRTQTGRSICPGEPEGDAGPFAGEGVARVLGYGKTWSGGGIRCTSAIAGLTCRNKSGHGFFLSRESWRRF